MRLARTLTAWSTALGLLLGPTVGPLAAQTPPPVSEDTVVVATPPPVEDPSSSAKAGAVAVNIFRVPGKTILCGMGTILAGGLMLLTGGTQYRAAGAVLREGCGGKWVIGPDDLYRDVDPPRAIYSGESR